MFPFFPFCNLGNNSNLHTCHIPIRNHIRNRDTDARTRFWSAIELVQHWLKYWTQISVHPLPPDGLPTWLALATMREKSEPFSTKITAAEFTAAFLDPRFMVQNESRIGYRSRKNGTEQENRKTVNDLSIPAHVAIFGTNVNRDVNYSTGDHDRTDAAWYNRRIQKLTCCGTQVYWN